MSVWPIKVPSSLPGLAPTMAATLLYLALIVLAPLSALIARASGLGVEGFLAIAVEPRVLASLRVAFGIASAAALVDVAVGLPIGLWCKRCRSSNQRPGSRHWSRGEHCIPNL
jgi:ABC-type sulfate transport system permease component